jgi:hypothetical protein
MKILHRRIGLALGLFGLIWLSLARGTAGAADAPASSDTAFEWLKGLAGSWRGKSEWSGGREGSEMAVVYAVIGNGSAVEETFSSGGVPVMTSVYHEDGRDLRMTHFCGAGNQPRLIASQVDTEKKRVAFRMLDMTGRRDRGHVDQAEIRFGDADHVTVFFTFIDKSGSSIERVELTRDRAPAAKIPAG